MLWTEVLAAWLIHTAIVSLVVLGIGGGAVLVWRQPGRRVQVIKLTLAGCLIAPVLSWLPGYPKLIAGPWMHPSETRIAATAPGETAALNLEGRGGGGQSPGPRVEPPRPLLAPAGWQAAEHAAAPAWTGTFGAALVAIYLAGAGLGAAWWLIGIGGLVRLVWNSRPAPARCRALLDQIAGAQADRVRLLVSDRVRQPLAAACGEPVIVLPETLCADEQAVRWSLAHEWTHVDRRDFRWWLLAGVVRVLFFYQPLVWWLRRQLRVCQDYVADAQAARQAPQPEDYAEFLAARAAAGSLHPALAGLGIGFHRSELYGRIVMLTQDRPLESHAPRPWTISVTLAAAVAVAIAAALFSAPSAAEEERAKPAQPSAGARQEVPAQAEKPDEPSLAMMGRVEDFFMNNFRDVSARKSLEWGKPQTHSDGSRSIRYRYEARIWDRETLVMNQVFTFDRDGKFVRYKNVEGFPKKKETKKADTSTRQGMIELVEDFFLHNFRDVTSRKTQEWGEPEKQPDGNVSIRYRYEARIWDKETKTMNQVFTFTPQGKFVSVKAVEG